MSIARKTNLIIANLPAKLREQFTQPNLIYYEKGEDCAIFLKKSLFILTRSISFYYGHLIGCLRNL